MKPEVVGKFVFKITLEGGRRNGIHRPYFGCPMVIGDEYFDCRLILSEEGIELGGIYELPVCFLRPDLVLSRLHVGKKVALWEGKEIATGKIISFV